MAIANHIHDPKSVNRFHNKMADFHWAQSRRHGAQKDKYASDHPKFKHHSDMEYMHNMLWVQHSNVALGHATGIANKHD